MARIGFSAAPRIMQCAGSLTMIENVRNDAPETEKQREGTAAHWVASEMIQGRVWQTGSKAPNGYITTEEMVESAHVYAEEINITRHGADNFHVEEYIPCAVVHSENGGKPDAWFYDKQTNVCTIWDYKFGRRYVDVYENWQLLNEAIAVMGMITPIGGVINPTIRFDLVIVQPRCFHRDGIVRKWSVSPLELQGYRLELTKQYEDATGDKPYCHVGDECRYCPAAVACEALRGTTMNIIEYAGIGIPMTVSAENVGLELELVRKHIALLESSEIGLSAHVEALLRAQQGVPGWTLEATKGRLGWGKNVAELELLSPIDITKKAYMTPTQAIKAGCDAEMVASYTEPQVTGLKLINISTLKRIFSCQ